MSGTQFVTHRHGDSLSWLVWIRKPRGPWSHRAEFVWITHCATVAQAVRTAQRQQPGWTVVAAERI